MALHVMEGKTNRNCSLRKITWIRPSLHQMWSKILLQNIFKGALCSQGLSNIYKVKQCVLGKLIFNGVQGHFNASIKIAIFKLRRLNTT